MTGKSMRGRHGSTASEKGAKLPNLLKKKLRDQEQSGERHRPESRLTKVSSVIKLDSSISPPLYRRRALLPGKTQPDSADTSGRNRRANPSGLTCSTRMLTQSGASTT